MKTIKMSVLFKSNSWQLHISHSQMCIFISSTSITINIWQIA